MSANATTAAPTGRKKLAQGKARSDATLGHDSPNTSSPERAKEVGDLPSGWRWTNLGQLKELSLYGPRFSSDDYCDSGVFVLRTTDISESGKVVTSRAPQLHLTDEELQRYQLKRGDLLITRTGSLGTLAVFNDEVKAIAGAYLIQYRLAAPPITSWYVFYALKSPAGQNHLVGRGAGVGRPNLNAPTIEAFRFPLPPEDEQRRIVAEIEKQFTRLEAGVAALRRVQANLKRYRAAVLKAACEGRLVPTESELSRSQRSTQNSQPPDETGAKLLARILTERRKNWQGRGQYKEPSAPATTDLAPLPVGWAWSTVEQATSVIVDCPHSTPKWTTQGRVCVRTTEFRPGLLDLTEVRFVSEASFRERIARLEPRPGDILYSREGGILGIACRVPDGVSLCLGQRMMLIRSSIHLLSRFIMDWLNSPTILSRVKSLTSGSASPHLNVGDIRQFPIPIPPLAEQTRIVAEVERRLSVVEELESVVSANLQRATRLHQSILQKALTGELSHEHSSR